MQKLKGNNSLAVVQDFHMSALSVLASFLKLAPVLQRHH